MKRVLLILGMFLSVNFVMAEDNVLQRIEIEPVKDTYNIVFVSDKAVDVKKDVKGSNKIMLTMKNIRASKTLSTVYNNVSNVDTVMVEPQGNGISVYFQADNAENATITFDSIEPVAPAKSVETQKSNIKLNNPIESYAPIYREDYSNDKTSNLFKKLTQNNSLTNVGDSLNEDNTSETAHKFISFGLITILAVAVLRLFKRKEPEMKIGLSQSLADREIDLYGSQPALNTGFVTEKPYTTVNYGLNAYKNESKNPYETAPVQIHNANLRKFSQEPIKQVTQTVPQQAVTMSVPQQLKKNASATLKEISSKSNANIDNMKFLESMTAIYEKSGRHDLAQGLKASLSKNGIK